MKADTTKGNGEYNLSEDQFQKICNSFSIGFALCELILDEQEKPKDYRFLKTNFAFEKQTGLKINSVIGKTVKEIYPDFEQSWIEKYGSVVLNNKRIQFSDFNHNSNRYYNVNAIPVSDKIFAIYFEDISEKTKSKIALEESEKQYKKLFNTMVEMFQVIELIYDNDGKAIDYYYLQVNPAFETLVNKKKEEVIGKRAKEIFGIVEEYWIETYVTVDKTGNSVNYENYGAELDKYYNINAWKVEEKKVAIIFTDITERKRTEKSLIESQRLKAIGEMASSIAHDFNNVLQSMIGNLEIAKLRSDLSVISLDRLNDIEVAITGMAIRAKGLQRFGDIGRERKESEIVDFNSILAESLKLSRPLWKDGIEKKGLKINLIKDYGDIPKINCNNEELKSAIFNLIKNSIEAMPKGGNITIKTGVNAKGVFLSISDTGVGMTEETKLKIFQPFYTTKESGLGRGLGMSSVYSLIKNYEGNIYVKSSELGKGTTIEIVFPASQQDEIEEISRNEVTLNRYYNVLWVDDDLGIRENTRELVEMMGHKCDTANGGKIGMQHLNRNDYDIVFTDIGMPEMNGWEFASAVRKKYGDKIKIVIVSGWDIEDLDNNDGNHNYTLQKPFTIESLEKIFMSI